MSVPAPTSMLRSTSHPPTRRINDLIRDGLQALDPDRPIAFFCECGRHGCSATIELTRRDYDERRAERRWTALAPGHAS